MADKVRELMRRRIDAIQRHDASAAADAEVEIGRRVATEPGLIDIFGRVSAKGAAAQSMEIDPEFRRLLAYRKISASRGDNAAVNQIDRRIGLRVAIDPRLDHVLNGGSRDGVGQAGRGPTLTSPNRPKAEVLQVYAHIDHPAQLQRQQISGPGDRVVSRAAV